MVIEQAVEEGELKHLIKDWVGYIIVNKGYCIKGLKTKGYKLIVKANADLYIIVTGTLLSNKLKDFKGLIRIFW